MSEETNEPVSELVARACARNFRDSEAAAELLRFLTRHPQYTYAVLRATYDYGMADANAQMLKTVENACGLPDHRLDTLWNPRLNDIESHTLTRAETRARETN